MKKPFDIALATCVTLPEPDPDAAPLTAELESRGIRAVWRAWDDPAVDWREAHMTVLRSTWNYPQAAAAFHDWLGRVATVSRLENPLALVRENLHKGYLLELERSGIPVPPTELVTRDSECTVAQVMERRNWDCVVVKPAVSAGSWRTLRAQRDDLTEAEPHLAALLRDGDALVQAYMSSVEGYGERAIVLIDGKVSHAVRKSPRFCGEDESVSEERMPISTAEQALVDRVRSRWTTPPLYARIDLAPDAQGSPVVMELELTEPSLFFDQSPTALEWFVDSIERRLVETISARP